MEMGWGHAGMSASRRDPNPLFGWARQSWGGAGHQCYYRTAGMDSPGWPENGSWIHGHF